METKTSLEKQLLEVLNFAINEEDYFHDLYSDLSNTVEDNTLKAALKNIAEQETQHKQKLIEIKEGVLSAFPASEVVFDVDEAIKPLVHPPKKYTDFKDVKEILEFAIKFEIEAKELYHDLANLTDNERVKQMLESLSVAELGHEKFFRDWRQKLN